MEKDTAQRNPRRTSANDNTAGSAKTDQKLKEILADLNRPLDDVDWAHSPSRTKSGETAQDRLKRIERERQHRRELRRARRAATTAFDVRPKLSVRKRATLMLGAGAMGLAAFTGPPKARKLDMQSSSVEMVVEQGEMARMPSALLKASDTFKQALIEEEGVRYTVYRDVAGYPTVGVGHLIEPSDNLRVGDTITEEQVMAFLDDDLVEAEQGVRRLVGDLPLFQHEFDALVDLVYNVGFGNASESESPRLNAAIAARDYERIAAELDYTTAGGKFAKGLMYRSERRAKIFMDASYEDPRESSGQVST